MASAPRAGTVYTIRHSTRTIPEFTALQNESAVKIVVDVRSTPRSRRNPQFNIDALPETLAEFGIAYQHVAELGGRRHRPRDAPPSPNMFWSNESFRNYADYAMTEPFGIGMAKLRLSATGNNCAIMCSEAVWWRCHRRIISDYLLAEGYEVLHIMGDHQTVPAMLTPNATMLLDGTLVYSG